MNGSHAIADVGPDASDGACYREGLGAAARSAGVELAISELVNRPARPFGSHQDGGFYGVS